MEEFFKDLDKLEEASHAQMKITVKEPAAEKKVEDFFKDLDKLEKASQEKMKITIKEPETEEKAKKVEAAAVPKAAEAPKEKAKAAEAQEFPLEMDKATMDQSKLDDGSRHVN